MERHDLSEAKFIFTLPLIISGIAAAGAAAQGGAAIANAVRETGDLFHNRESSLQLDEFFNNINEKEKDNGHLLSIMTHCYRTLSPVINEQLTQLPNIVENDSNALKKLSNNLEFALMDRIHSNLIHAQVNQRGFFTDALNSAGDFLDTAIDKGTQIAETVGEVVVDKFGALVELGIDHFDGVTDVVFDLVIQSITDAASEALREKFNI